jgi:hypothetical protein
VLLAGKGHENYQTLADRTLPFDDRDVARGALRARGYGKPQGGGQGGPSGDSGFGT